MSFQPGEKLAHFSIEAKLGEGGMGAVYRAGDLKLDRKVAIKVLPEAVANSVERLARFEREAKALAALNHPNVAGIHQVEHEKGVHFLVMELAEGQTLAQAIEAGAMPVEKALRIALQIAEALEAAHDRGIVHRDLKPANVMIAPDGKVKVLDFGLARAMDAEPGDSVPGVTLASHSPTFTAHVTGAGMLLGTAAYMSPEQARGDAADRRADIWAFGVVLFELLTGETVYAGKTISDTLAGVLAREPDWDKLPADLPRPIRRLLERCLHKEVTERLQAIGEARIAIRNYLADPGAVNDAETPVAVATSHAGVGRLLALALPLVAIAGLAAWFLKPGPPPPVPRELEVSLAIDGQPLMSGIASSVVLSRDGSQLAYFTGVGSNPTGKIRLRDMHRVVWRELEDVDRGYNTFFSPDGKWLGFVTPNEMFKVAVAGGAPLKLTGVNRSRGASWSEQGLIAFAPTQASGLSLISEAGGEPRELTTLAEGEVSHRYPRFLPGGTHVLYTAFASATAEDAVIKVVDVASGKSELLHQGGTYPVYSPSGHLLFWRDATVFGVRFDAAARKLDGIPVPVIQGVVGNSEGGAHYDVADDGTLVYLPGDAKQSVEVARELVWIDRSGTVEPATSVTGQYSGGFSLSPDRKRAAVTRWSDGNGDVWIVDLERETPTRLTFHNAVDIGPRWSADGKKVYFSSRRGELFQIFSKAADGSDDATPLFEWDRDAFISDVSRDGRWIVFTKDSPDQKEDLWYFDLEGNGAPEPFLETQFSEEFATFSPNGKWIAYVSDESGDPEVYVRPFPGPGGKWQVSSNGGLFPRWSSDGTTLYFMADNASRLQEVSVDDTGTALRIGRVQDVVTLDVLITSRPQWVVSDDGRRFGFVRNPPSASAEMAGENTALVRFTFDWFEELTRIIGESR